MGKSAKVHKRINKRLTSKASTANATIRPQVQVAKKKATLKEKTAKQKGSGNAQSNSVLGGADYVTLLMGGRRKANEEAKKLPQGDS